MTYPPLSSSTVTDSGRSCPSSPAQLLFTESSVSPGSPMITPPFAPMPPPWLAVLPLMTSVASCFASSLASSPAMALRAWLPSLLFTVTGSVSAPGWP